MAFWPNINILVYPHVPYTNMLMLSSFRKREIRNLIEQINEDRNDYKKIH